MKNTQQGNTKIYMLVGALVVAAGAVVFFSDNFKPAGENAAGTIVPAERYRTNQISKDDVIGLAGYTVMPDREDYDNESEIRDVV